jgi:hypothetical protein
METMNYPVQGVALRGVTKTKAIWVLKRHFLQIANISASNFDAYKSRWKNHPAKWVTEKRSDGIYLNVHSIPNRGEYITCQDEKLLAIVAQLKAHDIESVFADTVNDARITEIQGNMFLAAAGFHAFYNLINDKYNVSKENCKLFSQRWAVWQWITENYSRSKNSLSVFHTAYNTLFPGHLSDANSFSNFKKAIELKGFESKIIDQRAIVKVGKRITSFQYALLQSLFIQPQKIQCPAAHKKLIEACEGINEQPYSLASVKNYFREFANNAELYALRYGAGAAQKQLSYASLLPAEHRNTQWQIDGWTLPFWGNKFQRYVLDIVRDNHSRKIVGYSIAETENTTLILDALEDAMRTTGVFPGELVSDKHSFHKTEIAARLRTETERMGAVWTVTINAQRNQLAERYNQYLDALCKEFAGYLGKNMTATSRDARPSPEALTVYAKTANFKTPEEIKAIAAYVVKEFNKMPLEPLEGLSPNEKYATSEDKKCFVISESERLALVRPLSYYKVVRGQITIKVGMKKHAFQLPAALKTRYNNKKVAVMWEDLMQGIYITDINSGEELGCILPKHKIHGAIPDQNEDDRKWLNQLTGRVKGVTTTARKTAQEKITEALKANPEAIELINHYSLPKDIRALAQKDNELKRAMADQGINANMIPIREQRAAAVALPAQKDGKGKNSPFEAVGHEIETISFEDFK